MHFSIYEMWSKLAHCQIHHHKCFLLFKAQVLGLVRPDTNPNVATCWVTLNDLASLSICFSMGKVEYWWLAVRSKLTKNVKNSIWYGVGPWQVVAPIEDLFKSSSFVLQLFNGFLKKKHIDFLSDSRALKWSQCVKPVFI